MHKLVTGMCHPRRSPWARSCRLGAPWITVALSCCLSIVDLPAGRWWIGGTWGASGKWKHASIARRWDGIWGGIRWDGERAQLPLTKDNSVFQGAGRSPPVSWYYFACQIAAKYAILIDRGRHEHTHTQIYKYIRIYAHIGFFCQADWQQRIWRVMRTQAGITY